MGYTTIQRDHFMDWLAESEGYIRITSLVVLDALIDLFASLIREEES